MASPCAVPALTAFRCYCLGMATTPPASQPNPLPANADQEAIAKKAKEYAEWFEKLSDEEKSLIDGVAGADLNDRRK
jgi:hypothetical protein